jgi:hypothetical protein
VKLHFLELILVIEHNIDLHGLKATRQKIQRGAQGREGADYTTWGSRPRGSRLYKAGLRATREHNIDPGGLKAAREHTDLHELKATRQQKIQRGAQGREGALRREHLSA